MKEKWMLNKVSIIYFNKLPNIPNVEPFVAIK